MLVTPKLLFTYNNRVSNAKIEIKNDDTINHTIQFGLFMNILIQFNNQPITNGLISYSLIASQTYEVGPINL